MDSLVSLSLDEMWSTKSFSAFSISADTLTFLLETLVSCAMLSFILSTAPCVWFKTSTVLLIISFRRLMESPECSMDWCALLTFSSNFLTICSISPIKLSVSFASFPTSPATMANPFPCSPARAASMLAFKDNRLVCSEIFFMYSTIFWMLLEDSNRFSLVSCVTLKVLSNSFKIS